ncbi:hypothetical protein NHH03_17775 [Stieleria sp. TO1_6]|nr:hypothetical protein [Stieleria tagensis]
MRLTRLGILLVSCCCAATCCGQILPADTDTDLYSLVIAPIDLTDATRAMTVYDPDVNGFIDK